MSRSFLAAALASFALVSAAHAQGIIASTIGKLAALFEDSGNAFGNAAEGFDNADFTSLRGDKARDAHTELNAIESAMSRVIGGTGVLVTDLRGYAEQGRSDAAGRNDAETEWARISERVLTVRGDVKVVLQKLKQSDHVQLLVTQRVLDLITVTQTSRALVLDELSQLPAPTTPEELEAVSDLASRLEILMLRAEDLRLSLEAAALRVRV